MHRHVTHVNHTSIHILKTHAYPVQPLTFLYSTLHVHVHVFDFISYHNHFISHTQCHAYPLYHMSRNARTRKVERRSVNHAHNFVSHSLYTIWTINVYTNIYLFSLSTQIDSAAAAVQEQSSTVHQHKEILANTISMLYNYFSMNFPRWSLFA